MIFQNILYPLTDLSPLIEFVIFVLVMFITVYNNKVLRIFELGVLLMLISIIFFIYSIAQNIMIFSPYFQIFFIFFEVILFSKVLKNREKNE